jgi:hypothetical protein
MTIRARRICKRFSLTKRGLTLTALTKLAPDIGVIRRSVSVVSDVSVFKDIYTLRDGIIFYMCLDAQNRIFSLFLAHFLYVGMYRKKQRLQRLQRLQPDKDDIS